MKTKLSGDEIEVLQSLDPERHPAAPVRLSAIPKRLAEFNLVCRQADGEMAITQTGRRALFQRECTEALGAIARGEPIQLGSGVEKWLVAGGFVVADGIGAPLQVSARGKLWLRSFALDAESTEPVLTAQHFANRRSG